MTNDNDRDRATHADAAGRVLLCTGSDPELVDGLWCVPCDRPSTAALLALTEATR